MTDAPSEFLSQLLEALGTHWTCSDLEGPFPILHPLGLLGCHPNDALKIVR